MTVFWTQGEDQAMRMTMKASFLRAADIIDRITANDVLNAQAHLLATGTSLEKAARLDRAHLAAAHFRAIAAGEFLEGEEAMKLKLVLDTSYTETLLFIAACLTLFWLGAQR